MFCVVLEKSNKIKSSSFHSLNLVTLVPKPGKEEDRRRHAISAKFAVFGGHTIARLSAPGTPSGTVGHDLEHAILQQVRLSPEQHQLQVAGSWRKWPTLCDGATAPGRLPQMADGRGKRRRGNH